MSVSPIGNANFINQNTPVVSSVQANHQARFDVQNQLASELASEQKQEIAELRPAEQSHKIDPEHQHEKHKHDQHQTPTKSAKARDEDADDDGGERHLLDIKI